MTPPSATSNYAYRRAQGAAARSQGGGPQLPDHSLDLSPYFRRHVKGQSKDGSPDPGVGMNVLDRGIYPVRVVNPDADTVSIRFFNPKDNKLSHLDLSQEQYQIVKDYTVGGIAEDAYNKGGYTPLDHDPQDMRVEGMGNLFAKGYQWQNRPVPGQKGRINPFSTGDRSRYSASLPLDYITNRQAPKALTEDLSFADRASFEAGRLAGDVTGFGTQHHAWNIHPLDVFSTQAFYEGRKQGLSPVAARIPTWAGASILGIASGNWNPLNITEGGRQKGYSAITPTEEDPRESANPVLDSVFHRGFLGRTGRLLPWEQFKEERPEVSYEEYKNYQDYLYDPGIMNLFKATVGVDGPEARIMGYRVTPMGAAAAVAATAGLIAMGKNQGQAQGKRNIRRIANVPRLKPL